MNAFQANFGCSLIVGTGAKEAGWAGRELMGELFIFEF
jgi:hypothetical protein